MANHKSSKKRIRQTAAKRAHNRLYHKTARNAVKALRNTSEKSAAEALLPKVTTMLDKLASPGTAHTYAPAYTTHGARPREQRPRRPARHGIRTILPAFPHKAQDTRHTLRTRHLFPEYALYDKAARIAAGGFRFSPPGIPARHYPSRGSPDPPTASLLPGKP